MRFRDALSRPGLQAVAEVKRRSPSAGDLRPDADPAEIAAAYGRAGAAAVSVLVDERFAGTIDDLRAARAATETPLLGKGFFTTETQLDELKAAGADAALLILRDLDDRACARLLAHADAIGLDALVEAHDAAELERAVALGAAVIGLNARDLATFRVDRAAQLRLVAQAPRDRIVIAESGIESAAQGAAAELAGASAILVGSALMRAPDPATKLREILRRPLVKVCGLTREEDVAVAAEAGADLLGFILARETPRRAPAILTVPETTLSVAVHVGEITDDSGVGSTEPRESGGAGFAGAGAGKADLVQLYGREDGHRAREGVLLREGVEVARVLDQPWQEVDPSHWDTAAEVEDRVMLAGGLSAENVREAIERVRPWAVDAASRLEREPGIKDHEKVRAYVEAARCGAGSPEPSLTARARRGQYE
ncbi:MAG TPA: bifunctional indole-3-glycerol phosphate synthase/phosphoribosylanthranilate isomerase [Gaiellaceae bacterium]|nr:bifunctional indole-3-glycerol phosphate synthase/phosphoribosylanthranilate isomerase [Gaiellaceae bacterium]